MSNGVMVFAPAPQLTVTIEAQHDKSELHVHPGGQGIWQARMITSLGAPVTLCTAIGGEVGRVLAPLLAFNGVTLRTVQRESTTGWYVHDRRGGERQELAQDAGAPLSRHELDELYSLALAEGLRAGIAVLSGVAHPSVVAPVVYRRLASDLGANGVTVIADLTGKYLAAVLEGHPSVVKVSHEELIADGRAADGSDAELTRALHRLHAEGAQTVLVSRADEGALTLIDGQVYTVTTPRMVAAESRGAGDSMTAGVAAVLALGGSLHDAVRTGAAAGALNVTRHGLGTGRIDAVQVLTERVTLSPTASTSPPAASPPAASFAAAPPAAASPAATSPATTSPAAAPPAAASPATTPDAASPAAAAPAAATTPDVASPAAAASASADLDAAALAGADVPDAADVPGSGGVAAGRAPAAVGSPAAALHATDPSNSTEALV